MSDFTGLMATAFLGVAGFFLFYYHANVTHEIATQVLTGVLRGEAVSTRQRWLLLYNKWTSMAVGGVSMGIFLAIAQAQIGSHVVDPNVKVVAYLAAAIAGVGALVWILQGLAEFQNLRTVLRQAEAD